MTHLKVMNVSTYSGSSTQRSTLFLVLLGPEDGSKTILQKVRR